MFDGLDLEEIRSTDIWLLYERGRNYCRMTGMYDMIDKCYRFYEGDQWYGLNIQGVEPVCDNFIKPIVKYKVSSINQNLWAINYSAENYDNKEFRAVAKKTCELLNKKAAKVWEKDKMDYKIRKISRQSAIVDEGVIYITYDTEKNMPTTEIIAKADILYGNENESDIQKQPYILIKQRLPVSRLREMALSEGVSEGELDLIVGDSDTYENSGDASKLELENMATFITKLYKEDGKVHYQKSTRLVVIKEDTDSGLELYPVAHMLWEEKEGSARGIGAVSPIIPNQIEVNKSIMRRIVSIRNTAFPQKVVRRDVVMNPREVDQFGSTIYVEGSSVEDVNKVFMTTKPATMSADASAITKEIKDSTRELEGAGDVATGQVNPESASGRAILAVQQASQLPLNEHLYALKSLLEDIASIWFDMFKAYTEDSMVIEEEETDPNTGEEKITLIKVPSSVLQELQTGIKIDITPKGAFDKYAQEQSLENLLANKQITFEEYVESLDHDSVMNKAKLEEIVKKRKEAQEKIADIQMKANMMKQEAQQLMNRNQLVPEEFMNQQQASAEEMPMDTQEEMPQEEIVE